jgi:potassium-dependent mechanosensitive channel
MVTVLETLRGLLGQPTVALAASFVFLAAVPRGAAQQATTGVPQTPSAAPATGIAVTEVATRATEVANLIRTFNAKLADNAGIGAIGESLPNAAKLIDMQASMTMNLLHQRPTLDSLERQQLLWRQRQIVTASWLNLLTERAALLQDVSNRLAELEKTWTATRAAAQAANAPEPILRQIDETLASLGAQQAPMQTQRTAVLDLQARVAKEVARCGNVLSEIDQFQQQAVAGILVRQAEPIWSAELWGGVRTGFIERIRKVSSGFWADILEYVRDPSKGMPRHLGLFLVLALVFWVARRKVDQWAVIGESASSVAKVFDSPFAAALLVTLTILTGPISQIPIAVRGSFQILACVPMILLIRPGAGAWVMRGLYSLSFLFAIDTVRGAFAEGAPTDQAILVFETLAGMVIAGWLLRSTWHSRGEPVGQSRILRLGASLFLLIFAAGLIGEIIGYVGLVGLLISGTLAASITALLLYACVRVVSGLIAFGLQVWPLRTLRMVQHHRELFERRAYHLLLSAAIIGWVLRYLDHIGFLEPALSLGQTVLAARLQRGAINISVGDILAFFLTVWAAYLLSAFIRFVLEEDIYPRTRITQGMSYATSSLLHYVMLAVGFVAAIAALGVDLSKVTVLAGAFSVGIGFGLQSVVNNFVSGLILLFERPIDKGDSVEMGNLRGTVQHIGIRASVVHTPQGADIIVPNSQFIAEKVTNWTHGDRSMRIDLPIGVNYATSPKKVIDLLEAVARAHSEVSRDPPPKAIFIGFADSSINFELRAWTDEFANASQIRTDLAVAVYDAVNAAGMSFPFPQREVRLLSDSKFDSPILRADSKRKCDLPQKD